MAGLRRLVPVLASCALAGCSDETSVLLTFGFDCSVDPAAIQQIVVYFQPPSGAAIDGLPTKESETFEDDVRMRMHDVDADKVLEWELTLFSNRFEIRDGMTLRIVANDDPGPLDMRVVAGDAADRQIAQGPDREGRFVRIDFRRGEQIAVTIPLTCICLGLPACEGSCESQPSECQPEPLEGRHERLCGDQLFGPDDSAKDCADRECWDLPACEICTDEGCVGCEDEVCDDQLDNDCDGFINCGDDDCARALACRSCGVEDCSDQDDDEPDHDDDEDCDGKIDCRDEDCANVPRCRECPRPQPEVCDDAQDNDCDGKADCEDEEDCPRPDEETDCTNGFDDDCDDLADCADVDCEPYCCERGGAENCSNGLDDNCNHEVDCADDFCIATAAESEDNAEVCHDFADNDCDGFRDCEDDDCMDLGPPEDCENGIDDNCDGFTDCMDLEACAPTALPAETACGDGRDNDCDGFVDCLDTDCHAEESDNCRDGKDNDCNGEVDCSDEACFGTTACEGCRPESCSNGVSDDCDLWIDCADLDCVDECQNR